MISPKTSTKIKNPWSIQSIYQLQYFNCPTCDFKIHSKQKFIDHVHETHPESIEHMEKIQDGSLDDINCPWLISTDFKSEDNVVKVEFKNDLADDNFDNILKVEISNDIITNNSNNLVIGNEFDESGIIPSDDDENDNFENYNSMITAEDIEYQDTGHKCDKCNKCFSTKKYLQAHMSRHGPRRLNCEKCDKSYVEKRDLQTHMFKIHGIGNSNTDNFNDRNQQVEYQCAKCPKKFLELRYLRIHSRRHNDNIAGGKNFKCSRCSKSFSEKRYLQAHMARHEDFKKFKCEICGKDYAEKRNLQTHMLRHEEKKYPCAKCPKKFYQERELQSHVEKIHTFDYSSEVLKGEEVKEHKCEICLKNFAHKQSLTNHIVTVHEKKTIVQCEVCGKDFSCKGNLSIHMNNVHSDGKKYVCHICGKKFK